jgi:serine/threonine protein kinase
MAATTLRQRVDHRQPKIHDHQKWRWIQQLASAVAFAHQRAVAHRDIKPANIFIRMPSQDVWLADWDASICIESPCQRDALANPVCTYAFCAPEVFQYQRYNPMALDVWSVGVVALWLITGCDCSQSSPAECRQFMHQLQQHPPTHEWGPYMQCIGDACFQPLARRATSQALWEKSQAIAAEVEGESKPTLVNGSQWGRPSANW